MAASVVLLLSFGLIVMAQMASANIVFECLGMLRCDRKTPVCGSNGTHCWLSYNDCERAKFNCLMLFQTDFDKVDRGYCDDLIVGTIIPCCLQKECPSKNEPICGLQAGKTSDECKWFRNDCEMENFNCGYKKNYKRTKKLLCNFAYDSGEQYCTNSGITTTATTPATIIAAMTT